MYGLRSCRLHLRIVWMLPNTEPLRGSKVTPVSEKGQGKGLLKKGHGSWAVGFEFEIILQCGCQYDSYVTFQLEVLTGYFWINFDCVFYFCAKCSICLKEMNFSAEWIHNCSRWIIYYQPTELHNPFFVWQSKNGQNYWEERIRANTIFVWQSNLVWQSRSVWVRQCLRYCITDMFPKMSSGLDSLQHVPSGKPKIPSIPTG